MPTNRDNPPTPEPERQQALLEDLLRRAGTDRQALNNLLEALLPRLRDQVRRSLNVLCQDAQTDILCSIVGRILAQTTLPPTLPQFLGWVGVIVRNRCHDEWRDHQKRPAELPDAVASQDDEAKDRRAVLVWGALQLLSERDRHVLEETFYGRKSSRDIGVMMDLSEGAVRILRHRALKKLRAFLENCDDYE
jgi:RNA polymerase sigma-70 factor (ECF subfamily)